MVKFKHIYGTLVAFLLANLCFYNQGSSIYLGAQEIDKNNTNTTDDNLIEQITNPENLKSLDIKMPAGLTCYLVGPLNIQAPSIKQLKLQLNELKKLYQQNKINEETYNQRKESMISIYNSINKNIIKEDIESTEIKITETKNELDKLKTLYHQKKIQSKDYTQQKTELQKRLESLISECDELKKEYNETLDTDE